MKTVKLATFIENPDNPYKATEADLARLKGKLERVPKGLRCMRLGYVTDHVARDGTSYKGQRVVISGNKRLRELKIIYGDAASVPAEWFCDCTDMTPEERREFIVSANTVDGIPDAEKLLEQYDRDELAKLMGEDALQDILDAAETDEAKDGKTDADAVPDAPETPVSKRGEVYQLGNHRLMCGDATSREDMDALMRGESAALVFTDPPYNFDTQGGGILSKANSMKQVRQNKVNEFNPSVLKNLAPTNVYFHNKSLIKDYIELAERDGLAYDLAIYKKPGLPNYGGHLMTDIEYIAIIGKQNPNKGLEIEFYSKVFEGKKDPDNDLSYSKPVAICDKFIKLYSQENSVVLDLFGGSGTTMIACEQLERNCRMMELDPHYCDVIRRRWAEFVHGEGCDWQALTPRAYPPSEASAAGGSTRGADVPRKEGK